MSALIDFAASWLRPPRRTVLVFAAVGASAALTHLAVFAWIEHLMLAELANALGFVVAFFVSFFGHRFLSFQDTQRSTGQSLWRFAITALAGFATNEAVFMLLYRALLWPSLVALVAALILAAIQTFVLSRFWAFRA
jgi:putative flippase GtrA